jgi:hypothetical protein
MGDMGDREGINVNTKGGLLSAVVDPNENPRSDDHEKTIN